MIRGRIKVWMSVLGLVSLAGVASAQDATCEQDSDCAEGQRCDQPIGLVECLNPPCEDPAAAGGRCVSELLGEACAGDADCGEGLVCTSLLVDPECEPGSPNCPGVGTGDGFCAEAGADGMVAAPTLAASSGLAPSSGDTPTQESGLAGAAAPEPSPSSDSGGCSLAGSSKGPGAFGLLPVVGWLLSRRRRR